MHKLFLEARFRSSTTQRVGAGQRLAHPGPLQRPVWIHRVLAASSQCFPFPLLRLQGDMRGIPVSWHGHTRHRAEWSEDICWME